MKHFSYLNKEQIDKIFYKQPNEFSLDSSKETIENALGATLYIPAIKENLADIILGKKFEGLTSIVICLEDSIGDNQVEEAEQNLKLNLNKIKENSEREKLPLIFIRIRSPKHLIDLKKGVLDA